MLPDMTAQGAEHLHRFTLDEYHRLIDAGAFDEDLRAELIDGLLVDMSPKTPEHERAIRWLNRWLILGVDDQRYAVGVGSPLTLEPSEPEPDLTVLEQGAPAPYHPSTAPLVIEVAVSSLSYDLGPKAAVYSAAGIPDYWVADLEGRRVVVHRKPSPDGYRERFDAAPGDELRAVAVDLPPLPIAELLRAAGT